MSVGELIDKSEERLGSRLDDLKESIKGVRQDTLLVRVDTQELLKRQGQLEQHEMVRLEGMAARPERQASRCI